MRIDQETGEGERLTLDTLENVKFSSMAWTHDNKARALLLPSTPPPLHPSTLEFHFEALTKKPSSSWPMLENQLPGGCHSATDVPAH